MADIADVMDTLQEIIVKAINPTPLVPGNSVIGQGKIQVGQGWPQTEDIDNSMRAGKSLVSIFAIPSSSADADQPFMLEPHLIQAPVNLMTASVDEASSSFTLGGTPVADEYVTVQIGERVYSKVVTAGQTKEQIAQALSDDIAVDFAGTSVQGSTVSIAAPVFTVQLGAPGLWAQRIHRQKIQFRITIWSPNPADRAKVAKAIDVVLKREVVFRLADTSQMVVEFQGTNLDDKFENSLVYRRDIIVNVLFDTMDTAKVYEITAVITTVSTNP